MQIQAELVDFWWWRASLLLLVVLIPHFRLALLTQRYSSPKHADSQKLAEVVAVHKASVVEKKPETFEEWTFLVWHIAAVPACIATILLVAGKVTIFLNGFIEYP